MDDLVSNREDDSRLGAIRVVKNRPTTVGSWIKCCISLFLAHLIHIHRLDFHPAHRGNNFQSLQGIGWQSRKTVHLFGQRASHVHDRRTWIDQFPTLPAKRNYVGVRVSPTTDS